MSAEPARPAATRRPEAPVDPRPVGPPPPDDPAAPPAPAAPRDGPGPASGAEDVTDDVLVERAGLGDHAAFRALVGRHGAALYRYARRLLPSAQDAEDAVQDALTAAWLGADGYRGESGVRTWLFGIQTNCVRRAARRRAHVPDPVERYADGPTATRAAPGDEPVEHLLATDLRAALDRALADLPAPQRAAWLLVEVEGLSYADTAQVLGTSHAAVRGTLERARHTLGRRFAAWR